MLVRLLGPVEVVVGHSPTSAGSRERCGMLAALALHPGRVVSVDRLVDCMWGEEQPADVVGAVRFHASRLRRLLGDPAALVARSGGYVLRVDEDQVDAARFEQLVRSARARSADDPVGAETELDEALALWRGEPLTGVAQEPFLPEVRRLQELRVAAVEARLTTALASGRHAEVLGDLEQLVSADPMRERSWGLLMTALYRSGRQADALAAYQRLRHLLAEELGVEPSAELQALEHSVLDHDRALDLARSASVPTHRRSAASGPPSRPPPLPRPLSTFVGREGEISELGALLERRRLVTVVAPGGAGKTRLALETARRASARFPAGTHFVDLAPLRRPDDVAPTIARSLGITDALAAGAGVDATLARVAEAVGEARHLVLLDNCEHLLSACAHATGTLLATCPGLVVLATSRQALDVDGEQLLLLEGLDPPAGGTIADVEASPAGELFLDRARAVRPDPGLDEAGARAVAAICRRLDGLPLAVELAAARTRVLSPAQIADRLDDAFAVLGVGHPGVARHRTLEAALRWSYDLLDEPERALLARCSVFVGGFALDAAEAVAGDADGPVLDLVSSLVDKSLVIAGPGPAATVRYRLLEVVRQFAARTLRDRGDEDDARRRHRDHFAATATSALPTVWAGSEDFARLAPEVDNVRAAVRWSLEHGEATTGADLVGAYPCWMPLGLLSEAVELLQRALDLADLATVEPTALSAALAASSSYAVWVGLVDVARGQSERLGDLVAPEGASSIVRGRWLVCRANWAWIAADGDLRSIEPLVLASAREYEAAGLANSWPYVLRLWGAFLRDVDDDGWWERTMAQTLPRVRASATPRQATHILLMEQGHRAAHGGAVDLDECDRLLAEFGPPGVDSEANCAMHHHGLVHELVGDRRRAMADYRQHVWWCQQVGVLGHLPLTLRGTVRVLATMASERAATVHGAYEAVTAAHHLKRELPFLDRMDAPALAACRAALGDEAFERARAKGRGMGPAEAAATALAALDAAIG